MLPCYLVVPPPNVTLSVLDDEPIIGKPLSLECNVTVARGVTSSVDIIWMVNDTDDIRRTMNSQNKDVYKMKLTDDTTQYRNVYGITELKLTDNNTEYYCKAVINNTEGIDSVIVDNIILSKWLLK